jgi:hypothetical protein
MMHPLWGKQHFLFKLNADYTWGDGNADFVKIRFLYYQKGKVSAYDSFILRGKLQFEWRRSFDEVPDSFVFQVVDHSKRIPRQSTFARSGQLQHCNVLNFDKLMKNAACEAFPMYELGTLCANINLSVFDDKVSALPTSSGVAKNELFCESEGAFFKLTAPCFMKFRTGKGVLQWYESQTAHGPWLPMDTGWSCNPFAALKRRGEALFNRHFYYKLVSDSFTITGEKNFSSAVFGPMNYYVDAKPDALAVFGTICQQTEKRIDIKLTYDSAHQHPAGVNVWLKDLNDPSPSGIWYLGNEKKVEKISISHNPGQFHALATFNAGKTFHLTNGTYAIGIDFTPWNDFDCGFRWDTVVVNGPYGFAIESRMLRGESCPGVMDGAWTFTAKSALWYDTLLLNMPGFGLYRPGDTISGLAWGDYSYFASNRGGCVENGQIRIAGSPFFGKKLGVDTVLCKGQVLSINAGHPFAKTFEVTKPDGTRLFSDTFMANMEGEWRLRWSNDSGCVVYDTLKIKKRNLAVTHDFLMPAQVKLQDTVWAVDHSHPKPISSQWIPEHAAWHLAEKEFLKFYLSDTGIYPVTLISKFDSGCTFRSTKWLHIVRTSDSSRFLPQMGYQGPVMKSFLLKPNPSGGLNYQAVISLRAPADVVISLLDPISGRVLRKNEYKQVVQIAERPFDIESEGVYFIRVAAGNEIQTRKILIIRK